MEETEVLPKGWKNEPLSELITFATGGVWGDAPDTVNGIDSLEAACIRGTDFRDWEVRKASAAVSRAIDTKSLEKRKLQAGDILVEVSGGGPEQPVGRTVHIDEEAIESAQGRPMVPTNFLRLLRLRSGVDAAYVNYYLKYFYVTGNISDYQGGSNNLRNLRFKDYITIEVPLAPLPEQRRIVSAIETQLGRLDAAVARLHAAKAKLKRYKQAVLKAAVEGKLGSLPDAQEEATGQEILDRLLNERREKWNGRGKYKEPAEPGLDDLPALPEGWAWATVEQLSTKVVDGVHKKPNYVESGVPFVTVRNLTAGPGISFESLKYITEEDHIEFIKRANPEFGDVLITKDGTLGVVRYVDTHKVFSIFVSVAMVKPVDRTMGEYLSVALSSPIVQVQMVPKGSGLQHIHLEDLRADCVPIPPMSIQRWIVEEYNSYETKIQELESTLDAQLLQSTRLRQAVLKRAFEGRLV